MYLKQRRRLHFNISDAQLNFLKVQCQLNPCTIQSCLFILLVKTWCQSWNSYITDKAGFSSNLWITYRLTNCPIVVVLLYRRRMNESEGTRSDVLGLGSQGYHPERKNVFFHFSLQAYIFLWNVPVTWQIVYHPYSAAFFRLKPKKVSFGMLSWHLLIILSLDLSWPLRLNYVFHNAPCTSLSFLDHIKEVSLVFHGKSFIPYRKILTWNKQYILNMFSLLLFFRCSAFWWNVQGFSKKQIWGPHFQSKVEWKGFF